jgi:hypothetical protein
MNEPVCWIRQDGVIAFHEQKEVDSQSHKWNPLYTLRELTDEEIMQIWVDSEWGDGEEEDILLFARAIERELKGEK